MVDILAKLVAVNWVPIFSALPPLLAIVFKFTRTPRSRSKLDEMVELHDKLPETVRSQLADAMKPHVEDYVQEIDRLARRRLDWSTVSSLLAVASASFGILCFVAWLAVTVHWGFWFLFALIAVFSFALLGVGMGQVYKYPERTKASS